MSYNNVSDIFASVHPQFFRQVGEPLLKPMPVDEQRGA